MAQAIIDVTGATEAVWLPSSHVEASGQFTSTPLAVYADGSKEYGSTTGSFGVLLNIPGEGCQYEISASDHADFANACTSLRFIQASRLP